MYDLEYIVPMLWHHLDLKSAKFAHMLLGILGEIPLKQDPTANGPWAWKTE